MFLNGYMGNDNVCIQEDDAVSCITAFDFLVVTQETGMFDLDGVLGLAPNTTGNGPSFFKTLFGQHVTVSPVISIQLGTTS
jgi:hypothetical protein